MDVIDDIASRLDPAGAEAARTDALTLFGLMLGSCSSPGRSQTPTCPISSSPGGQTAMKLLNDPAVEPVVAST
jgi:hypothetical protein